MTADLSRYLTPEAVEAAACEIRSEYSQFCGDIDTTLDAEDGRILAQAVLTAALPFIVQAAREECLRLADRNQGYLGKQVSELIRALPKV